MNSEIFEKGQVSKAGLGHKLAKDGDATLGAGGLFSGLSSSHATPATICKTCSSKSIFGQMG